MITISKEYKQVNRKLESSLNEKKNLRKTLEAREKELMAAERQVSVLQKALQESKAAGTSEPSQQGSNREALATLAKALKSLQVTLIRARAAISSDILVFYRTNFR